MRKVVVSCLFAVLILAAGGAGAATPSFTCSPSPGATFPVGVTTVTCTATDSSGNTSTESFTVTVEEPPDTTPPVITVPADITVEAASEDGAAVDYVATAVDDRDGPLTLGSSPPTGTSCFASPGSCGFPDPATGNVGVPSSVVMQPSGSMTITEANSVWENLDIRGTLTIAANNVTIRHSRITGIGAGCGATTCGNRLVDNCSGCLLQLEGVELTTDPGTSYEFGVRNPRTSTAVLTRVYQHGDIDAMIWNEGTASLVDSYSIIGKATAGGGWGPAIPGDHLENVYSNDATFTIQHSTVLNPVPQTSTFFGNTNNGFDGEPCKNVVVIENSLLAGGGHLLTHCAHSSGPGTGSIRVEGNRIARCGGGEEVQGGGGTWLCPGLTIGAHDGAGYYPNGGSFGLRNSFPGPTTWAGNVWDDTGAAISGP